MGETTQTTEKDGTQSTKTEICRIVSLKIEDIDHWGSPRGGHVKVEPVPGTRRSVAQFLGQIAPGKKIERLGRAEMVLPGRGEPKASCLFFQALHACFSDHHALTIRPEVLMHLIVGEVAATVNRHPEAYRALFTRSDKKELVTVRHDGLVLGDPESPWHEAIAMFDPKLRELVPPGLMEHMLPEFSTATVESRTASLVAFMDAAQQFYSYRVKTRCGIPEVRLAGTPEDYRKILNAAAQLAEPFRAHLGRYFDHLLPVLKTLAEQAVAGTPLDETFWASIYKYQSGSGSATFNGWATAFLNYVQTSPDAYRQTAGETIQKPDDCFDWTKADDGGFRMTGLDLGSVPSHVATAPFIWDYYGTEMKMRFAGGVLGVDDFENSVMPVLSYAILHDE